MDREQLQCKKVAVLVTDGFEQAELLGPRQALEAAGVKVDVISNKPGQVQGFQHTDKGEAVAVDKTFGEADAEDYDAVVLPGGVVNGDAMRMIPEAIDFVQIADEEDKPIAVICHGGWLLISADLASGRTVTRCSPRKSTPSAMASATLSLSTAATPDTGPICSAR